jgi:hypothetical protein
MRCLIVTGIVVAALCLQFVPLELCAWEFHSPAERPTHNTAYTLAAKQKRLAVGLYGTQFENVLGTIGLAYAPFRFWEIEANLAHFGAGIFNIATKFNLAEVKWFGLGLRCEFAYVHGKFLWALPKWRKKAVQGLDAYIVPIKLIGSLDIIYWLHFDLVVGYDHVESTGHYSGTRLFFDGYLGARQVYLLPVLRFYLVKRLSLNFSGKLPMWARVHRQVESELTITPGVIGGIRSAGEKDLEPLYYWLVTAGAQVEIVPLLYLKVDLSVGSAALRPEPRRHSRRLRDGPREGGIGSHRHRRHGNLPPRVHD